MPFEQVGAGHAVPVLQGGAGAVPLPHLPHHLEDKEEWLISVLEKVHVELITFFSWRSDMLAFSSTICIYKGND